MTDYNIHLHKVSTYLRNYNHSWALFVCRRLSTSDSGSGVDEFSFHICTWQRCTTERRWIRTMRTSCSIWTVGGSDPHASDSWGWCKVSILRNYDFDKFFKYLQKLCSEKIMKFNFRAVSLSELFGEELPMHKQLQFLRRGHDFIRSFMEQACELNTKHQWTECSERSLPVQLRGWLERRFLRRSSGNLLRWRLCRQPWCQPGEGAWVDRRPRVQPVDRPPHESHLRGVQHIQREQWNGEHGCDVVRVPGRRQHIVEPEDGRCSTVSIHRTERSDCSPVRSRLCLVRPHPGRRGIE